MTVEGVAAGCCPPSAPPPWSVRSFPSPNNEDAGVEDSAALEDSEKKENPFVDGGRELDFSDPLPPVIPKGEAAAPLKPPPNAFPLSDGGAALVPNRVRLVSSLSDSRCDLLLPGISLSPSLVVFDFSTPKENELPPLVPSLLLNENVGFAGAPSKVVGIDDAVERNPSVLVEEDAAPLAPSFAPKENAGVVPLVVGFAPSLVSFWMAVNGVPVFILSWAVDVAKENGALAP